MKPLKSLTVIAALLLSLPVIHGESGFPAEQLQPVWKVDLIGSGYAIPNEWPQQSYLALISANVFFVSEHTIAVTYLTANPKRGLTTKDSPGAQYVITTVLIDSKSGTAHNIKSWGNFDSPFAIQPALASRIAVLDRWGIDLYSDSFEKLLHVDHVPDTVASTGAPPPRHIYGRDFNFVRWELIPSPTRRTLLAVHQGWNTSVIRRLDSSTLSTLGEWKAERGEFGIMDASDKLLAFYQGVVLRSNFCLGLPPSCLTKLPLNYCGAAKFIADDRLVLTRCTHPALFGLDGKKIASVELGDHTAAEKVAFSEEGHRFALLTYKLKGRGGWRDVGPSVTDEHIVVYSGSDFMPAYSLAIGPHQVQLGFALSPTGAQLVVLRDQELSLYEINH